MSNFTQNKINVFERYKPEFNQPWYSYVEGHGSGYFSVKNAIAVIMTCGIKANGYNEDTAKHHLAMHASEFGWERRSNVIGDLTGYHYFITKSAWEYTLQKLKEVRGGKIESERINFGPNANGDLARLASKNNARIEELNAQQAKTDRDKEDADRRDQALLSEIQTQIAKRNNDHSIARMARQTEIKRILSDAAAVSRLLGS